MALASQPLALQILIELGAPGFCAWRITFGRTMVEGYSRAHIRSDQVRRDALSSGRAAQAALFDDAQDRAKRVARRGITSRSFRLQRSASINQCRGTPPMRLMRIWCTAECAAIVSARLWRADGSKKNRVKEELPSTAPTASTASQDNGEGKTSSPSARLCSCQGTTTAPKGGQKRGSLNAE